ncbi:uncharacterized protein LOC136063514 [Quercus suber]|uniref:uncharacterized protein LOC136063514 n=1 Tax=Quercus suber TaxID=58331 RepID=UPI0032DFA0F1
MEVMMNALKGRVSSDLNDLVNRTYSPFTVAVNSFPLPHKFRILHIDSYDGVKDPLDHLETFKTLMYLQGVAYEIMCRAFPTTLKGPTRVWFSRLTLNSISTFKELSAQFTIHFIGGHRYKKFTACLMSIKQREDETLKTYITRFNKEALSINEVDDKILVAAFTNGLQKGKFLFSLYKNNLKTMSEVLYRAIKYMNDEDTLQAQEEKPRKRERPEDERQDQGRKKPRTRDRRDERRSKPPGGRFTSFTPLTTPIDQVLMQIKDEGALTFPGKLKGDPSKRSRDKYCRFHRDYGHDTADCYDLKQQIEALIRQGKLQKFVSKERTDPPRQEQPLRWDNDRPRPLIGDIRMIVGGTTTGSSKKARKTYLRMVQNVQLTGPVLVDNGSLIDILYYPAFQQMRIGREQLIPTNALLVDFGGTMVFPLSAITLFVTVGNYPQQITKDVTFLVVDCSSAYNAILGQPTLNSWKAATSAYHLMIKFPTDYRVGELSENQMATRECYVAMMKMKDHLQAMSIEEHQSTMEPIEQLEEILLDASAPDRTTKIGTFASPVVRQALTAFLKKNQDVFAWSHEDMPGIDPSVMVHRLNVSPSFPPVRQKKRVFTSERDRAIAEEVCKL